MFDKKISVKDYPTKWTDRDFESLSWHDNFVHGIRLRNPHEGYDYDLVLDIDHILDRIETPSRSFQFIVAPATLTFSGVNKLEVNLKLAYKEHLEIERIEREETTAEPAARNYRWEIIMHSLNGKGNKISFEAQSFTQELTKKPIGPVGPINSLEEEER
jgi:hypothetical protein